MNGEISGAVGPARDAATEYRRLLSALAARAARLGSRDAEAAAQEALKRSLESPVSQAAVEFYFSQESADALRPPEWPLDQLLAWLHGVVRYVVQEERNRAGTRREVWGKAQSEVADPAPGQLEVLIRKELEGIVEDCMPSLDREYRTVLAMRADGLKYGDIAVKLGVNENTVATWVSRGIRTLAGQVRRRTGGRVCV